MEGFLFGTGYVIMVVVLLALALVAIRLLPFLTTIAMVLVLLQVILPGMAIPNIEANIWHQVAVMILAVFGLMGTVLDFVCLRKRLSNFWCILATAFGKD